LVPEFQGPPEQRITAGNNGRIHAITGEDPSIKERTVNIEASSRIQECPFCRRVRRARAAVGAEVQFRTAGEIRIGGIVSGAGWRSDVKQ
jgi:hypothetical protein